MRNKHWVFGINAGLRFSPNPVPFVSPPINSAEACASISDRTTGNLIIYSDGVKIMDASGTVKVSGLLGHQSSTQGALIVPHPTNPRRYYVFTTAGSSGGNQHVNGVLIDTALWTWAPIAFLPPPPTVGYSPTEKLVAIRHANQQDFWVLTVVQLGTVLGAGTGFGALRVFLVNPTGVHYVGDQSLGQMVHDVGYLKASPRGQRLALVNFWLVNVLVIPFSSSTGTMSLSGLITIPTSPVPSPHNAYFPYGAEFSPNGEVLYYSTVYPLGIANSPVTDGLVFQVFLPSGQKILLGAHPKASVDGGIGALQFGSNGRIYIAQIGEPKLGVIANPDVVGPGCNLAFNAVSLAAGSICNVGLPNFIRELF